MQLSLLTAKPSTQGSGNARGKRSLVNLIELPICVCYNVYEVIMCHFYSVTVLQQKGLCNLRWQPYHSFREHMGL